MSRAYKYCATRGKNRRENIDSTTTCIPLLGANDWRTTTTQLRFVFLQAKLANVLRVVGGSNLERIDHLDDEGRRNNAG